MAKNLLSRSSHLCMRAVVLAGGKGVRLRPFTTLIPKPLVPLGGKFSILEIILLQLKKSGFEHVTLAVNHLSHLIMSYFGNGERFGIRVDYSIEDRELSTVGPLTLLTDLPENVLVMNGDILCDLDFKKFYQRHLDSSASLTITSYPRVVNVDFGVLKRDKTSILSEFQEKPKLAFEVSMGIYCIQKAVLQDLPKGSRYGFDQLMTDSLAGGRKVHVFPFNGYWLDIGRTADYESANNNFSSIMARLGINAS